MSVSLHQVLTTFQCALDEELCWALAHQTLLQLKQVCGESETLIDEQHLFITENGTIDITNCESQTKTQNELFNQLGVLLFRALDFGLQEDEERSLSRDLESLIEALTSFSEDEGIEGDQRDDNCDHLIHKCCQRVKSESPQQYYSRVLKSVYKEVNELNDFLTKVKKKDSEELNDWARLWVNVIRQLREGRTRLKPIESRLDNQIPLEFELTPFELLLEDIREKRYKLNPVLKLNAKANKDAHELILDFIRSRPALVPVSQRQLKDAPLQRESLYDKLMQSIRQKEHNLKPTQTRESQPIVERVQQSFTPQPQRRLIKADLNLRLSNSFDDEEEDHNSPQSSSKQQESQQRKFSLKNLSLKLLKERRHSFESPNNDLDVNEDTRQHVADIWQSCEWGRALQCLSLTLQEVQHIRSVLTKAELETLAVTRELREDLESGRICFTCLKTRFSFFGSRAHHCKVCERTICERCVTRMHIPCETFDKVPIYMLSPTPSPPLEQSRDWEQSALTHCRQMEPKGSKLRQLVSRDSIVVDAGLRKSGPLVRVCRDCKRLVRHLIDTGSVNHY